jgi:hypothetical protein
MGTRAKRILAAIISASMVATSATGWAAPARRASPPPAATVTPPVVRAAQPVPMVQAPPAAETPKQRKAREKAEAKARKKAEKQRQRALDPNREKRKKKRKKIAGCVAGAALGIVAGMLLSNRRNRGEMVVAGAIGGCAAGWALGGALKGDDKDRLDTFVNEDVALREGEPIRTWVAPNSGATITIQQTEAGYKPIEAVFNIAPGIQFPQSGVLVEGRAMRVTTALRLRGGPSTSTPIVGSFAPNEIVHVIAQTPDQQWALIGENNVVVGYASKTYLSPSLAIPSQAPIRFATMKRTPPPRPRPVRGRAAPAPVILASGPPQVARVQASTRCKSMVASHGSNRQAQQRCAQSNSVAWV